ncbi:hypothetical protein LI036_06510 [bacterium 210917-DFI.7.65]|nr:hypothetical protein [bacterium 210917-DFI.7.65]
MYKLHSMPFVGMAKRERNPTALPQKNNKIPIFFLFVRKKIAQKVDL